MFIVFHSQKQSTLIFVSQSIRTLWLQVLYLRTLFLGSKCWMHPRHIHPMGNLGPNWKRGCYLEVCSYTLFFNTNKKGAVSSKFLNLFLYTPLFKWHDVRWYFPGLWGVSETTMWHSRTGSLNTFPHVSLFTKDDDSAKMATAQCCFWQKCFRHFRSTATSSFDRIYPWSKQCIGDWFGQILFLCAVLIMFHSR